ISCKSSKYGTMDTKGPLSLWGKRDNRRVGTDNIACRFVFAPLRTTKHEIRRNRANSTGSPQTTISSLLLQYTVDRKAHNRVERSQMSRNRHSACASREWPDPIDA